jgi:hypothetical protein
MPQSQRMLSAVPFVAIERPACPECKAQMMLVSIEPVRACVIDLHTFECAVCNQALKIFAAAYASQSHPPPGRVRAEGEVKGWKWAGDLRVQVRIIVALIFVIWMVLQQQYY